MGAIVKAKVVNLEEELREGFSRQSRKELTVVFQGVLKKRGSW